MSNFYKPISQERDPEKISQIIREQLEYEKRVRVTEEVSQKQTITAEAFLNSPLVNRKRTYGLD